MWNSIPDLCTTVLFESHCAAVQELGFDYSGWNEELIKSLIVVRIDLLQYSICEVATHL